MHHVALHPPTFNGHAFCKLTPKDPWAVSLEYHLCSPFHSVVFCIIAQKTYWHRFTSSHSTEIRLGHVTWSGSPWRKIRHPCPCPGGRRLGHVVSGIFPMEDDTSPSYWTQEWLCDLLWPLKCGQSCVICLRSSSWFSLCHRPPISQAEAVPLAKVAD